MTDIHISRIDLPFAKRLFDIFFSLFLLILTLPFVIFLFLWIGIEFLFMPSARGPLFYREVRVSRGREIEFYKFRIFKLSALKKAKQKNGVIHTKPLEQKKENLTGYGRFLKQVYMDELPQLWLVLKGDMTLVGPRPTNTENSKRMKLEGDYTKERMWCGITGPFQAEKGKRLNQRVVDENYINFVATRGGFSVLFKDIKILIRTIKTVFEAKGI